MSQNRIAASKPNRRIGCSVTSAANSGVWTNSRNECFSFSARYSGKARPAWRISQTGGRSTADSDRHRGTAADWSKSGHAVPFARVRRFTRMNCLAHEFKDQRAVCLQTSGWLNAFKLVYDSRLAPAMPAASYGVPLAGEKAPRLKLTDCHGALHCSCQMAKPVTWLHR